MKQPVRSRGLINYFNIGQFDVFGYDVISSDDLCCISKLFYQQLYKLLTNIK